MNVYPRKRFSVINYVKLLCGELNLKVSILRIRTLQIKLDIRNKIIIEKKLYKKKRKVFCSNLELNQITDNHLFWKPIKFLLNDKSIQSSTITLVKRKISDDLELAETFNNYFESPVAILEYEK